MMTFSNDLKSVLSVARIFSKAVTKCLASHFREVVHKALFEKEWLSV